LWGWTSAARGLLAALAVAGAVGLLAVAPGETEPVAGVPRLVVDPNTAPPEVLAALPTLGPALVARIVAARSEAPFRSLEELDARVPRIGPATIAALRPYLHIAPAPAPRPKRQQQQQPAAAPLPVRSPHVARNSR
jgi:competence protein ComEA